MAGDTITHLSHPEHELVKRHYTGLFRCDMCWEGLSGPAYGCRAGCDFAIHDACAAHPPTLFSPAHHPHQLVLVETRRDVVAHVCDVCAGRCAPGCFLYRCPPCGFDMHPRCARLPPAVRSGRHLEHDLALVFAEGRCTACQYGGGGGGGWFYRCDVCKLDLHVSCAAGEGPAGDAGGVHGDRDYMGGAGDVAGHLSAALLRTKIAAQSQMHTVSVMTSTRGWRISKNLIG